MKKHLIDEMPMRVLPADFRKFSAKIAEQKPKRDASQTDEAFVRVAAVLWSRDGMSDGVKWLGREGDLYFVNPESVDDEGREFLLTLQAKG